ncbi:MAG: NAD(P)H-hydrate dehydratase [Pseudomonadota bacterium]
MPSALINHPDLWREVFPQPKADDHKYRRGHTVILGSTDYTGATRLAAEACSRIGSGLVTVLSADQSQLYRTTLPADIMVKSGTLSRIRQPSVLLAGPGGCDDAQASIVTDASIDLTLVLDADAIRLSPKVSARSVILTPHHGEFERHIGAGSNDPMADVCKAAQVRCQIIVLKGPETLIAAPDGRLSVNRTASPYLAKAGTGDVLSGLIAGLAAQGMPPFEAACAGVWLHGSAGQRIGAGLIPQDIIADVPALLRALTV